MSASELLIAMTSIGGLMLLGLVGTIGGFLHYRRERLLLNQERMKALELGRQPPDDPETARVKAMYGARSSRDEARSRSLARKCFNTALGVGCVGFGTAILPGLLPFGFANTDVVIAIAASAGAIGVTAIICGTILALRMPSEPPPMGASKPAVESDAFDVVSSRG
jgi:hypothetical protein